MSRSGLIAWLVTIAVAFGVGWYGRDWVEADEVAVEPLGPALRAALSDGSQLGRSRKLTQALERLDSENLGEALEVYEAKMWGLGECEIRPFVDAWARFDPAGAVDSIRSWPKATKQVGLEAAIWSWAQNHPAAARIAAEQLIDESPLFARGLTDNLVVGWVHSGVGGVVKFVEELPQTLRGGAVVALVGSQGRRLGTAGLLDWADDILGDATARFRKGVFRRTTAMVAREDPRRAAAWLESHAAHDYARDGVRLVAENWMPLEPDAAVGWVRAVGADAERELAIRSAFSWWLRGDRADAEGWLRGADLTPLHDPAIDLYAQALAGESRVEEALSWAERIRDETLRLGSLKGVASRWHQRDPAAAEAWLEHSPLDEEARQEVKQSRRRPDARRRRAADERSGS
jgi:hypothetical protein